MLQIADEVILDPQIALVDFGDEGQAVHVLENSPVVVVGNPAVRAAETYTVDRIERSALGDFLDREIELLAGDKIDRRGGPQTVLRFDGDLSTDHADLQPRVLILQRLGDPNVRREGRGRGMKHRQLIPARDRQHVGELKLRRRRVDQSAIGHECCRLREPSRVPEGANLAFGLIA